MTDTTLTTSSSQPDPRILRLLVVLNGICLTVASLIAGVTLFVWLCRPIQPFVWAGWSGLKGAACIGILLSVLSLVFSQPRRSQRSLFLSRAFAATVALIGLASWMQRFTSFPIELSRILVLLMPHHFMGIMSNLTARGFFLLGIILLFLRSRKSVIAILTDLLTLVLTFLILVYMSAYVFGAFRLLSDSSHIRISTQAVICLTMLNFVAFSRRAEYGFLSILLGSAIGSRTARVASPIAIVFPFLLSALRGWITKNGIMQPEYASATVTSVMAILGFCLILIFCKRANRMESEIRALSLRDELTGLYNRRGFYLLAEQAQALARRSGKPFSILFVDVDGLKRVNDEFGHETGSALLREMATSLEKSFRDTDVISRIGGDEFAIACSCSDLEIAKAVQRLEEGVAANNTSGSRTYKLCFSFGHVTSNGVPPVTLDRLLEQADSMMYEAKRNKQHLTGASVSG